MLTKRMVVLLTMGVALIGSSVFAAEKRIVDRQTYGSYGHRKKSDAINACESELARMLDGIESGLDEFFDKGFEYECSEIIINSESDFDSVGHMGSMRRGWLAVDHKYTIEITIGCVPRKLSEKALFSMARRCEVNPTEACFDDKLLEKLDSIGTTKFSYEHKGSSCKPLQ